MATVIGRRENIQNSNKSQNYLNLENAASDYNYENMQDDQKVYSKHRKYKDIRMLLPIRSRKKDKNELPLSQLGLISFISSFWMTKYLWKAYRKKLTESIPHINEENSTAINGLRLEKLWERELKLYGSEKASFLKVTLLFQKTRLIITTLVTVILIIFVFFGPAFLLRMIIEYLEIGHLSQPTWFGIVLVLGLTCSQLGQNICGAVGGNIAMITGIRLKGAVMTVILRKIFKLQSLANHSVGQIVNVCVQDSAVLSRAAQVLSFAIVTPLQIIITVGYTCFVLGPWALLGCFVIIMFYPFQAIFARILVRLSKKSIIFTDKRVNLMNNILNNIMLIKMTAWEKPFTKLILELRNREVSKTLGKNFFTGLSNTMAPLVPIFAYTLTIIGYTLSGNNLSPSVAFSVVTIFNSNIFSLALLSWVLEAVSQMIVSCQRIKELLLLEDMDWRLFIEPNSDVAISFTDAYISNCKLPVQSQKVKNEKRFKGDTTNESVKHHMESKDDKNEKEKKKVEGQKLLKSTIKLYETILFNINLQVLKGQLVGICGSVGSGKSSLLKSILRELKISKGSVSSSGKISYVPQQAFIYNTTLRENILFGRAYNDQRYLEIVFACCLKPDFEEMPNGDMTEIGEKGVNLSGGQKQRISLARALYNEGDIYLLDNPLSAVDPVIGRHIYSNAILEILKIKSVVLISHQLQYLKDCDTIAFLKGGRIFEMGSYNQLMELNGEFTYLYKKHVGESENSESNTQEEIESEKDLIDKKGNMDKLIQDEEQSHGRLKWKIAYDYIRYGGSIYFVFIVYLCIFLYQASAVFNSFWLGIWLQDGGGNHSYAISNKTQNLSNGTDFSNATSDDFGESISDFEFQKDNIRDTNITHNPKLHFYIFIFGISLVAIVIFGVLKNYLFMKTSANSSIKLHASMFMKVLRSPISFFDTNPLGRILNRFSGDLGQVDVFLPMTINSFYSSCLVCLGAALQIAIVEPIILAPFTVFVIIVIIIENFFRIAINDLKRLESMSNSPVISHLTAIIQGLSTIRAFKQETQFLNKFQNYVDSSLVMSALYFFGTRWYGWWLSIFVILTMMFAGIALILTETNGAMAGVALSASLQIALYFQHLMQNKSLAESTLTSVERIHQYIKKLPSEAALVSNFKPPDNWPQTGKIVFDNVHLKYQEKLPLVLKGVSLTINANEKVGIVGRSGAGKSTIVSSLFRMSELFKGRIIIDNMDISKLGLHDVRSKISIIPQEPQLFTGTLRYNLDPFDEHTDEELWAALEKAHLKQKIREEEKQLDMVVNHSGENFSIGERQLLCLARALLQNRKILILDEATASVDTETDSVIQETVKEKFLHSTVLTIAHRLNTVLTSDKIMVMQAGEVIEFDTPAALLANKKSTFYNMVVEAGLLVATNISDDS